MLRTMLKSKIHGATVTESDLNYVGSISIDCKLIREAGFLPFEKVLVVNLSTGARAETYVLEAPEGSGTIGLNGGLSRKGSVGDRILIFSFVQIDDAEAREFRPKILILDNEENKIQSLD